MFNGIAAKESLEVTVGSPITLHCDVCSNPVSDFTWYRDGKQLGHGKLYTLHKVTYDHSGIYSCISNNTIRGVVHSESFKMTLSVHDPPSAASSVSTVNTIMGAVLTVAILLLIVVLIFWAYRTIRQRKGNTVE